MIPSPRSSTPVSVLSLSPETGVVISGSVIHLLASELSNYRHTVRSTTKRAIELMASAKGCTTTEILSSCRGPVESQIFSKQLRAVQVRVCLFFLGGERRGGMSSMHTWFACTSGVQQETLHTHE